MINRVTHQMTQRSTLANMQSNLAALSKLQDQASSMKRIQKASDDPAGTAQALRLRAEQRASAQYDRNMQDGVSWLNTIDTALSTTATYLQRARDLTVRGANTGSMGQTSREAIATEIEGIRDSLLGQANTTYLGRHVFAGTSNAPSAVTRDAATGTYTYNGGSGAVERRVAESTTIRVDADGAAVFGFGPGETSVFALLDSIAAELRAGTNVGPRLNDLDTRLQSVLTETATIGARTNQMEAMQQANTSRALTLKTDLSAVEDVDLAETIVNLQAQEVAYQAALGAAGKVLQPTLLDYLR